MTVVRAGAFNGSRELEGSASTSADEQNAGDDPPPFQRVLIIGAGLIGTSVGLALRQQGIAVSVEDADSNHVRVAVSVGAGEAGLGLRVPDLVVVAVPPSLVGAVVAESLDRFEEAVVTDVSSVKERALEDVTAHTHLGIDRYLGSHPMAGSEQSGPLAARADLFVGRPWAITRHSTTDSRAVSMAEALAQVCGAVPVSLTPAEHDEAVALVSHLPHVASSVVASLLGPAADLQLNLAGQGLRDVTRVAAGDPELWTQILSANAGPVAGLLREAAGRLDQLARTLEKTQGSRPAEGSTSHRGDTPDLSTADSDTAGMADLQRSLERGVAGVRRLPGKHGTKPEDFALVSVSLPDRPGELAHLFVDVETAGVNIEDVRIDHSPATPAGLVELAVHQDARAELVAVLGARGWSVHG